MNRNKLSFLLVVVCSSNLIFASPIYAQIHASQKAHVSQKAYKYKSWTKRMLMKIFGPPPSRGNQAKGAGSH